jgi:hypothetical protein
MNTIILLRQDPHSVKYVIHVVLPIRETTVESFLSSAYVHAIASRSHFCYQEHDQKHDFLKIDGDILGIGYERGMTGVVNTAPHMYVQLKVTFDVNCFDHNIHYKLDVPTFVELNDHNHDPHLLILLVLPKDSNKWLIYTPNALISRKCAYWCSLLDYPDKPKNGQKHITIKIPTRNVFSVEQLKALMDKLSRKESIKYGSL